MRYLLDSTVLIDYLRGRPAVQHVRSLHETGDAVATTPINVEEIIRGLRPGEATAAGALFDGLSVVPVDDAAGWRAGTWRREFAARGVTLWPADCLIAAVAFRTRATLVTANPKDFPMDEITVQHWPVRS